MHSLHKLKYIDIEGYNSMTLFTPRIKDDLLQRAQDCLIGSQNQEDSPTGGGTTKILPIAIPGDMALYLANEFIVDPCRSFIGGSSRGQRVP